MKKHVHGVYFLARVGGGQKTHVALVEEDQATGLFRAKKTYKPVETLCGARRNITLLGGHVFQNEVERFTSSTVTCEVCYGSKQKIRKYSVLRTISTFRNLHLARETIDAKRPNVVMQADEIGSTANQYPRIPPGTVIELVGATSSGDYGYYKVLSSTLKALEGRVLQLNIRTARGGIDSDFHGVPIWTTALMKKHGL